MGSMLSEFCIYALRHSDDLKREFAAGRHGRLEEHKAWAEGERLRDRAQKARQLMPIVFSAAEHVSGLIFWATIEDIDVERDEDGGARTACRYRDLRQIEPTRPMSELTLKSRSRPLSARFIRSYAICRTPGFLEHEPGPPDRDSSLS